MNKSKRKGLSLAKPITVLKLDLACGQSPKEGFEGVDIWPGAKHVVDLMKFPWPWENDSVAEIYSSHFIEHLPARSLELSDIVSSNGQAKELLNKDFLFAFFDECYRILKSDGVMTIICPCGRNNRGFQDPTHRRFIVAETFAYLSKEWRAMNKLDHYNVKCDFQGQVNHTQIGELQALSPEVAARRLNEAWNVVFDWHVTMKPLGK